MNKQPTYKLLPEDKCLTEHQLFDYIDGKMNATEMHLAEKHMLACEMCSDALEGLEKVSNREKVAAFSPASVFSLKEEKEETKIIPLHSNRKYFAMAAGLVLILAVTLFFKYSVSTDETSGNMAVNEQKDSSISTVIVSKNAEVKRADSIAVNNIPASKSGDESATGVLNDQQGPASTSVSRTANGNEGIIVMDAEESNANKVSSTTTIGFSDRFALDEKPVEDQKQDNVDLAKKEVVQPDADKSLNSVSYTEVAVQQESKSKKPSGKTKDSRSAQDDMAPPAANVASGASTAPVTSAGSVQVGEKDQENISVMDSVSQTPKFFPLKPSDKDLDLSYEKGVKMLDSGQVNSSLVFFDEVMKYPKHQHYEDAQWKKSVALIKLNRKTEAKVLLLDIEKKGGKYKAQATAELKKLQ